MSVAESFVSVRPDMDGFGGELRRGLGGLTSIARTGGLAIGAALVGAGAAIVGVGREFEDAYNKIRVGTGATGDALEDLKDDFRDVARTVPAEFGDVSTAIADLNTRLGLTGEPLQDISEQFLELSRITETDLAGNIESVTRAFGDWAIEDHAEAMDKLFRASQNSGAEVGTLADQLVQFGAPMRDFGFSFEDTTALLADFERSGVNTEAIMSGLRQSLSRIAEAGEEPREVLFGLIEAIDEAGLTAELKGEVFDIFGTRAGSDLARAIEEGRFSVEDMLEAIEGGEDTILGAAEDTRTLTESWQTFKNNAMLALEPIAERVLEGLSSMMEDLAGWWEANGPAVTERVEEFAQAFEDNWPAIKELGGSILELLGALGDLVATVFGDAAETVGESTESQTEDLDDLTEGIGDVISVLTTLTEATTAATENVNAKWDIMAGAVTGDMDRMEEGVWSLVDNMGEGSRENIASFTRFVVEVRNGVQGMLDYFSEVIDGGEEVVQWFRDLPERIVLALTGLYWDLRQSGRNAVGGFIDGMEERIVDAGVSAAKIAARVRGFFPSSPAKEGPFSGEGAPERLGANIARQLGEGMAGFDIGRFVEPTADQLAAMARPEAMSGAAGGSHVTVYLGDRELVDVMFDEFGNEKARRDRLTAGQALP